MSAKHTPGPWEVGIDEGAMVFGGPDCREGVCDTSFKSKNIYQEQADARLISAAPEMLNVLKVLVEQGDFEGFTADFQQQVLAVIAKAEGR